MVDEKVPDSTAASSTAAETAVVEDDYALPEEVKDEKSRARFQKLVDRAKAAEGAVAGYQTFGTPDQIAEYVEYAKGLEANLEQMAARVKQLETQREAGEPKTQEQKDLEAKAKTIRQQIRENEPVIEQAEKQLKAQEERETRRIAALRADALDAFKGIAKDYGIPANREAMKETWDLVEAVFDKNERLAFRFERDPKQAIQDAMQIIAQRGESLLEGKRRVEQQRAQKNAAVPRAHGGGGGPGTKPSEPAKTIADAVSRGVTRWRERGA